MSSPTERSLKWLRKSGYVAEVTEQNIAIERPGKPRLCFKRDLFGFIDILAVNGLGTLAVQCTSDGSGGNVSARVKKTHANPATGVLLRSGWRIEVHGWTKGKRGGPRVVCVGLLDSTRLKRLAETVEATERLSKRGKRGKR